MTSSPRVVAGLILALQLAVLAIGITRDYRLKHEDNNALHATFARAHLQLGFGTTKGQNYFYSPSTGSGSFYLNHPPGPALVLAAAYALTGHDGPFVTRATAILFHLTSTVLFLLLAGRVFGPDPRAVLAMLVFVLLPESAFFGRMLNHEVLVLSAALLLVRAYWEVVYGCRPSSLWFGALLAGCLLAATAGWAGFFVIGACGAHAAWEAYVRENRQANAALGALLACFVTMFVVVLAHLVWVQGEGIGYFLDLLGSRMNSRAEYSLWGWVGRVLELHWRYFSLTGMLALVLLSYRALRSLRSDDSVEPWAEAGLIFVIAGVGYVLVFNLNATRHDYWQFLLLPASALAVAWCLSWLSARTARAGRRSAWLTLLVLVCLELTVTITVTLGQRHIKAEGYCLETVAAIRRDAL